MMFELPQRHVDRRGDAHHLKREEALKQGADELAWRFSRGQESGSFAHKASATS